jgi:hypothetical protein
MASADVMAITSRQAFGVWRRVIPTNSRNQLGTWADQIRFLHPKIMVMRPGKD